MSLSVARPIVSEPGGTSGDEPGRRILSIAVARFDGEPQRADEGTIWVGAASGAVGSSGDGGSGGGGAG